MTHGCRIALERSKTLTGDRDILPHAPYLINLANPDAEIRAKSYATFLDDLQKCEQLRIQRYNFQCVPIASQSSNIFIFLLLSPFLLVGVWSKLILCYFSPGTSADKKGGIKLIAECINDAHKATTSVKIVLENAAGHSNCIGDRFEDLRGVIDLVEGTTRTA